MMMRTAFVAALSVTMALLSGCAAQRDLQLAVAPLANQPVVEVEDAEILGLSPEMMAFLDARIDPDAHSLQRTMKLAQATLEPGAIGFVYDPMRTLTAAGAFAERRGNCLAFSNMFIAMARHVGLDAWYQEVMTPPQWSDGNDAWLVNLHVNVVVAARNGLWIVDVSGRQARDDQKANRLTDAEARALYLNNLGAEALLARDLAQAYAYFRKAIGIAPNLPHVWSNLGVVFDRNGQTPEAIRAYRFALELDPVESRSANNLYLVYQREGRLDAAAELRSVVEKRRRQNPYYLFKLAREAFGKLRYADAARMLQRAIRLNDGDYRFHYELARTQAALGKAKSARKSLARARERAPPDVPVPPVGAA